MVRDFYSSYIFKVNDEVREALTKSFSLFV